MSKPNQYGRQYDELLERHPPHITWRRKPNGILVHVSINDPHGETTVEAQADRMRYNAQLAHERELLAMEAQAREVAARVEQHRADNTPLMQAARSAL